MNISDYMSDKLSKRAQSTELQNLLIVDPNPCGSSVINVEDLSISVELEVFRRSDDIIIFDNSNANLTQKENGTLGETTRISFIDGSGEGEKHLTTNYTEVSNRFAEQNPELQTLGIESIDIGFNTSYVPIVKIRFKDIRGKLFEMGPNSPYGFLFRMPYPIFYLTIKGYYGKPVQYPLHLTKFNGALDSDTGSFIITCDFIGYTYAFLTDLLMGYLRAMPYTERARGLLETPNGEFENFVTYDQLQKTITELDKFILKFKQDDEKLKALTIYGDLAEKLDKISGQVKAQLKTLEYLRTVEGSDLVVTNYNPITQNFIRNYNNTVMVLVNEYNQFTKQTSANTFELDKRDFELDNGGIYIEDFELDPFVRRRLPNEDTGNTVVGTTGQFRDFKTFEQFQQNPEGVLNKYKKYRLTNDEKKDEVIRQQYDGLIKILKQAPFMSSPTVANLNQTWNLLDPRFALNRIDTLREQLNNELIENKNLITEDFISKLSDFFDSQGIDFDGSIGSFFRILCRHVDLFVNVIRDLGIAISKDISNGDRTVEGTNKENFTESEDNNNNSTITIKPFPEYVEKEDNALVEKWLGSNPKFAEFKEVKFINDFLDALIKSSIKQQQFLDGNVQNTKGWYPVNPLETIASNSDNVNPWSVVGNKVEIFAAKLLYQRMVLYLAYTNSDVTDEEFTKMAKIEARQMYDALVNASVRKGIVSDNTDIDSKIANWSDQIKERFTQKLKAIDGQLYYYHIDFDYENDKLEEGVKVYIPVQQTSSSIDSGSNLLNNPDYRISETKPFVSSVVSNAPELEGVPNTEEYETFIKIINTTDYSNSFIYDYDSDLDINPLTKNFKSKESQIRQYSKPFGGRYRTHEFLEYEHEVAGNIPLYFEFYQGGNDIVHNYRDSETSEYDTFIKNGEAYIYNPNARQFENNIDRARLSNIYETSTFKGKVIDNYKNQKINNRTFKLQPSFKSKGRNFSLFGSEFYYRQSIYGKALLFLHTLPFAGMGNNTLTDKGLLQGKEINYFNQRGGFVSVPYAWILFMGGMIYRTRQTQDILVFNNSSGQSIVPNVSGTLSISKDAYLLASRTTTTFQGDTARDNILNGINMEFFSGGVGILYSDRINNIIDRLPESVKDEFVFAFESFVQGDWERIRAELEIFTDISTPASRTSAWNDLNTSIGNSSVRENIGANYAIVAKDTIPSQFVLDLRDGSDAANEIINLLFDERIIVNSTYRIWQGADTRFEPLTIPAQRVANYLRTFFNEFKSLNTNDVIDPVEQVKIDLFNSTNDDDIKLSIYKNIKSIYDKWIVGIPQDQPGVVTNNLYEKFSFLDRAYIDISEKFKVAPTTFVRYWKDNTNINFYNFIARILRDNNFDFIPLPTYINYNDKEEIRDVFEPFRFNEAIATKGPQFICMYFGEQSNKLEIDKDAKFKRNDSWSLDVRCNDRSITVNDASQLPSDFVSGTTKVPYFLVNYADQNQSLFKTYSLDQAEFTETQESLEIIESLANQNRNNSIGQNLFDIYNNRAYSCEIEMLGCAQIQPFMYFQLNNIPMFDGAYTIINTRHNIRANHMTTTFKGVRVRAVKTKMIDDRTLYAHLINNLNEVSREGADLDSIPRETTPVETDTTIEKAVENQNTDNETQKLEGIIIIE